MLTNTQRAALWIDPHAADLPYQYSCDRTAVRSPTLIHRAGTVTRPCYLHPVEVAEPPPKSPSMRVPNVPQLVSVRVSTPIRLKRAVMPKSPPCMAAGLSFSGIVCAVGGSVLLRASRSSSAGFPVRRPLLQRVDLSQHVFARSTFDQFGRLTHPVASGALVHGSREAGVPRISRSSQSGLRHATAISASGVSATGSNKDRLRNA